MLTTQPMCSVHSVRSQKLHTKHLFFGGTRGTGLPSSPEQPGSAEARTEDKARLKQCDRGLTQSVSVQKYQCLQNNRITAHHWFRKGHGEIITGIF